MPLAFGPDAHGGVGRQLLADRVEPVRNGCAHGVAPRRAAQDHVDERVAHVRRRADRANVGRPDQRLDDGLGDLRFQQLRAARPLRVDDHLRVRDVRDRVERRGADRVDAGRDTRDEQDADHASVADDPVDERGEHGYSESPDLSLLSASTKKLPMETTWSPSSRPSNTCVYSSPSRPVCIVRGEYSPLGLLHVDDAAAAFLDDRDVRDREERALLDHDFHQIARAVVARLRSAIVASTSAPPGSRVTRVIFAWCICDRELTE